ncbi:hypothetical protein XB05_01205 [Xanthomonas arboricola]|nr:hypothetical protein XB05_01205 [Xanthomonas arboricola]
MARFSSVVFIPESSSIGMTAVADCMRRMLRGSSWLRMFRCGRDGICGVQLNAFKPADAPSANACACWRALVAAAQGMPPWPASQVLRHIDGLADASA